MPRNVRPTFVEISVDGKAHDIATGPRASNGGMVAQFYIRDHGSVARSIRVECESYNGIVRIVASTPDGQTVEHKTEY